MRTEALAESELVVHESAINHVRLPPDEQLLCYDYLYYTATNFVRYLFYLVLLRTNIYSFQPFEFEYDYSPAWRFAGQHMHWAPELEKLADQYVRLAMGLSSYEPTPPVRLVAIHNMKTI